MTKKLISVKEEDIKLMRSRCRELFLKEHPEMDGRVISDWMLFGSLVKFYLKS